MQSLPRAMNRNARTRPDEHRAVQAESWHATESARHCLRVVPSARLPQTFASLPICGAGGPPRQYPHANESGLAWWRCLPPAGCSFPCCCSPALPPSSPPQPDDDPSLEQPRRKREARILGTRRPFANLVSSFSRQLAPAVNHTFLASYLLPDSYRKVSGARFGLPRKLC